MKFDRRARYEPITLTQRKASAFARKQAKERDRYPLFADHIASEQHDLETEMSRRQSAAASVEAGMRGFHARTWRESRARYFALPEDIKAEVRAKWNAWVGPRTSTYYAWMVDTLSGDQAKRKAAAERERKEIVARLVSQGRLTAPAPALI